MSSSERLWKRRSGEDLEELKIEIEVEHPFHAFTYITGDTHCIEVDYFARMIDPKQRIVINPEDHSSFKWIMESEISNYFEEGDAEKEAIVEGFRFLRGKN